MRKIHRSSIGLSLATIAVVGFAPTAVANAGQGVELTPDATAALAGVYQTVGGEKLSVLNDNNEPGERTIIAASSSGEKVRYVIQYTSITEADRATLAASLASQKVSPTYSDVKTPAAEFRVSAPDLSEDLEWTPVSVIATTDKVAAVAWTEREFSAQVDGANLRSQDGQVVFDVEPNEATSVTLEASEEVEPQLDFRRERQLQVSAFGGAGVAPLTYQQYTTAYVHKTFIPDATVSALYCLNAPSYTFGGDNRGFQYPTNVDTPWGEPNYRTMMFGNVNWENPSPYNYVWTRDVGASKIYNNGSLVATLYASTDDMNITGIQVGSQYAKANFDHTASNPHCSFLDVNYGGAIRYNEWVEYYRSGTVSIDGYRFKAPAHEMYARFNTSSGSQVWGLILRRYNEGFACLLGNVACGMDFYQQSASY